MLDFINDLRAGKALVNLIRDPQRTEEIFKIAEIGLSRPGGKMTKHVIEAALGHEGFRALYESRYLAPKVDLNELAKLPASTLGGAYARHMQANRLDPEFFPRFEIEDPVRYLAIRARESHDIWHVLAGYDTTVKGELALQGLTLAQTNSGISTTIICAGLLHVVKAEPSRVSEYFAAIAEGFERGKRARFLLATAYEELWERPLVELQKSAGL